MKVQVLYAEECPNWQEASAVTRAALDALGLTDVPVEHVLIRGDAEAERSSFGGSPTILVDGADLFASAGTACAHACRVYPTEQGLSRVPNRSQVEDAIRARPRRR